ncbi:hypothetical protein BRADI_2g41294v3 [Brachypodium distachyon]|uniref:Uncharacterized protein n=1 Tax=Brachypodium distachyon TaxID=15368 RepID=A0A0Q3GAB9_BRADI|nr:hypothetical protein BRADI_2g41294v3 [Brachypodium distachyon]
MASLCSNPHIIECKDGWVDERTSACIFTSCCEGGEIAARSRRQGASYFLKNYLHCNRVLRHHFKCSNILLTKDRQTASKVVEAKEAALCRCLNILNSLHL